MAVTYGGDYFTFGFGAIIRCDLQTLLLPRKSPRDNHYVCDEVQAGNATLACLASLAMKKSGGTITLLHMCPPR